MRVIERNQSLSELCHRKIGFAPEYPDSNLLVFLPLNEAWCGWDLPTPRQRILPFLNAFLVATGVPDFMVMRRKGIWIESQSIERPGDEVIFRLCALSKNVEGTDSSLWFPSGEFSFLACLLLGYALCGRSVWDDIYFVSLSHEYIFMLSHHSEITAHFRTDTIMKEFDERMTASLRGHCG